MAKEANEEAQENAPKKSSTMKFIILGVLVLVLAGGGFFGWKTFLKKEDPEAHAAAARHATEPPVIKEMDTFIVNLSDAGGKRYLKLTMKIKLNGHTADVEVTERVFELRDNIIMTLSSKSYEDIATPEDKLALKQELIAQLNKGLQKGKIQDIYFTEFLVQ